MSQTATALIQDLDTRGPDQKGTNVELGVGANAGLVDAGNVVIGPGGFADALATQGSVVVGRDSATRNARQVVVGYQAGSAAAIGGVDSVTIGPGNVTLSGQESVGIGSGDPNAAATRYVAVGHGTLNPDAGVEGVAVGALASAVGLSVSVGASTIAAQVNCTAVGNRANAGQVGTTSIGGLSVCTGSNALAIGVGASAGAEAIAFGNLVTAGANSLTAGSATTRIGTVIFGSDPAAPSNLLVRGQDAAGTDVNAPTLDIRPGKGTGAGSSSDVRILGPVQGVAGTTPHVDAARATFAETGTTIHGNLTVLGSTTILGSANTAISDNLIILRDGAGAAGFGGIAFERGSSGDDAVIVWNETDSRFEFGFFDTVGGTVTPSATLASLAAIEFLGGLGTTFINIGNAVEAVSLGDIAAHTAASAGGFFYDASANTLRIGLAGTGTITAPGVATGTEQFGAGASAAGLNSTAVGSGATTGTGTNCTAIGQGAAITFSGGGTGSNNTIVIGQGSSYDNVFSALANAVVIGTGTTVTGGNNDCIIGSANTFTGGNNAYVGSLTTGTTQIAAIGTFMQLGDRAAAVGDSVIATGSDNVVIGASASSGGFSQTTILGRNALATGTLAVAIGANTTAGANSIAITGSASLGGLAIGNGSIESGTFGIALGNSAVSASDSNVATGSFSYALGAGSITVGGRATGGSGLRITTIGANSFPIRTATITVNDLLGAGQTIVLSNSPSQVTITGTEGVDFTIGGDVNATATSIQTWLSGLSNMTATVLANVVTVFNANSQGYITALVSNAPSSWTAALEAAVNDTVMVGEGISAVRSGDSTLVGQGISVTFSGVAVGANSVTAIGQGISYNSTAPGGAGQARAVVIGDNITSLLGDRDTLVGSFIQATGGLNAIVGSSVIAASQSCGIGRSMQLGTRSVGMGDGVISTGTDSVVLGATATDGGFTQSIVLGSLGVSTGIRAIAIGFAATAGQDAIAIRGAALSGGVGIGTASSAGGSSVAIGNSAKALGSFSNAIGLIADADGQDSNCFGRQAIDNGNNNVNMFGFNTMATGIRAIGIGSSLSVGKDGIAIGTSLTAAPNTCLIGNGSGIGGTYITKVVFGGGEVVEVAGGAISDLALGVSGAFSSTNGDRQGGNFAIFSGPGTGIGPLSTIKLRTPVVGVTGTTPQVLADRITVGATLDFHSTPVVGFVPSFLNIGAATGAVSIGDLAAGTGATGGLFYDASAVLLTIGSTVTIGANSVTVGSSGAGSISIPGAGANSEQFGAGASAGTGISNVVLGQGATIQSPSESCTVMGKGASTSYSGSATAASFAVVIGLNASATLTAGQFASSVSIGVNATTNANGSIAIGVNAAASSTGGTNIAIGNSAAVTGTGVSSICIGNTAISAGSNGVIIGTATSQASGDFGVAIGAQASTGNAGTAIGFQAVSTGLSGVAVGAGAISGSGISNTAIGVLAACGTGALNTTLGASATITSPSANSIAVGNGASVTFSGAATANNNSTVIGQGATATISTGSNGKQVVIGQGASLVGSESVLVGQATSGFTNCTIIGSGATATFSGAATGNANAVVIGRNANSNMATGASSQSVCIGNSASVQAAFTTAVGDAASAVGTRSTSLGMLSICTATDGVAIGFQASAGSVATVVGASASGVGNGLVFGFGAVTSHVNSMVFGRASSSTATNQLVIGSDQQLIHTAIIGEGDVRSTTGVMPAMVIRTTDRTTVADESGKSLVIRPGRGTGLSAGTTVLIQTPRPTTSGTTQQLDEDRFEVGADQVEFQGLSMDAPWSVTALDFTTAATTTLFTVPVGKTFIYSQVLLHTTAATGAAGDTTGDVNVNAGASAIVPGGTISVSAVDDGAKLVPPPLAVFHVAVGGDTIDFTVGTVDTTATVLGVSAYLFGVLV